MSAPATDVITNADAPELAATLAAEVIAKFAARAAAEFADDWYSYDSYARFVALLETGTAHSPAPRTVIAGVPGATADDVETWGYVAAEVLDAVAAPHRLPDTALITDEGPGRYRLTW